MEISSKIKRFLFVTFRIWKYKWLSDSCKIVGKPMLYHPLLIKGKGTISFGKNVQIGVIASPNYYSHYTYLEVRYPDSTISIGDNVAINNAFSVVAFSKITISDNVLIGVNCCVIDNDGHDLAYNNRAVAPESAAVFIGKNVFLGDNVTLLKGVHIGENSVIGNRALVTKDIPANSIAAGVPAEVIRSL